MDYPADIFSFCFNGIRYSGRGQTFPGKQFQDLFSHFSERVFGQQSADFISCVAFGKNGEFAEKYFKQGTKIAITGRIQTGSYTNRDGQKIYTTDIVIEEQEFAESKKAAGEQEQNAGYTDAGDGFMNIPDGVDEQLPFA